MHIFYASHISYVQVIKLTHPLVVEDKIGVVGGNRGVDTLHLVGHG